MAGGRLEVVALFGPTAVGKTAVAVALAKALRERGEDPVAVNCDSIQVYRGLEVLSGAASAAEQTELEHRLLGFVDPADEFSAGAYAELAHEAIDRLLIDGRRPIVVGGTGLYLQAALAELQMRPAVPSEVREEIETDLADRGAAALHAELPEDVASGVHPNDRKRIVRLTELVRLGITPHPSSDGLWTEKTRRPSRLFGITLDRDELRARIADRVAAMVEQGAGAEVIEVDRAGASRTARAAIGFSELLRDDVEAMESSQRAFARRQLTWMRKMPGVEVIDRTGLAEEAVAARILESLDS